MPRHTGTLRQSDRPTADLMRRQRERDRRRARLALKAAKSNRRAVAA